MNLVIWRTFVWLFGALPVGLPCKSTQIPSSKARVIPSFWMLWGIVMSLLNCMIEKIRILLEVCYQ